MAEYIKREAVLQIITDAPRLYLNDVIKAGTMRNAVNELPAADVRENVRGKWTYSEKKNNFSCSICRCESYGILNEDGITEFNSFCPNCGADMRGDMNA